MKAKLMRLFYRLRTKNFTSIPLLKVYFDDKKYKKDGKRGCIDIVMRDDISKDVNIRWHIQSIIDYIRDEYNIEDITQVSGMGHKGSDKLNRRFIGFIAETGEPCAGYYQIYAGKEPLDKAKAVFHLDRPIAGCPMAVTCTLVVDGYFKYSVYPSKDYKRLIQK